MKQFALSAVTAAVLTAGPAHAALSMDAVNRAQLKKPVTSGKQISAVMIRAQVLLDRSPVSPGVIDGRWGGNTRKALKAFQGLKKLKRTGSLDRRTWTALTQQAKAPVVKSYVITRNDVNGPFTRPIPTTMRKMAKLQRLAYTSPKELLAERFHMAEGLLVALNRGVDFKKPGTRIVVAAVGSRKLSGKVARVVVDKQSQAVKLYNRSGGLVAFYPATVGSKTFPSPKGHLKVTAIAERPSFTYSSKLDYAKLKKGEALRIPPGPNNPVGIVWVDLNKEGYGIHGTPEPARVSKTASHGCVRLTNWDAMELAHVVKKGTPVLFGG
jgi:lipoprotein-anchoring transpeptidase ErfK/SrfK